MNDSKFEIQNSELPSKLGYRMPAEWEPHVGTWFTSTDPKKIIKATKTPAIELTRDEWYRLLLAAAWGKAAVSSNL